MKSPLVQQCSNFNWLSVNVTYHLFLTLPWPIAHACSIITSRDHISLSDAPIANENGSSPKPMSHPKLSPKAVAAAEAEYFPINMTSAPTGTPPPKEEKPHNERKRRASTDSAEASIKLTILEFSGF